MLLRVNKRIGMWGFGEVWFTFADQHSKDIDIDSLHVDTKNRILGAINKGILFEVDENDNPVIKQAVVMPPVKPVVVAPATPEVEIRLSPVQKAEVAKVLELGVRQIRAVLGKSNSVQQLMFAIEYENTNKKRTTVIKILQTRISQLAPTTSLGGTLNPYDVMITDEKQEVITVKLADLVVLVNDDEEQEEVVTETEEMI